MNICPHFSVSRVNAQHSGWLCSALAQTQPSQPLQFILSSSTLFYILIFTPFCLSFLFIYPIIRLYKKSVTPQHSLGHGYGSATFYPFSLFISPFNIIYTYKYYMWKIIFSTKKIL